MAMRVETNPLETAYAVLLEHGLEGAGEALRILVNEATKVERSQFLLACLALMLLLICGASRAQEQALDASLNESVQMIVKPGLFNIELETTIYKPEGAGPFPVVVINHGKAEGNPRFQRRYRPLVAVRYFLQRGYAVVVPMRQGFSRSSGNYIGGGCNVESNGRAQADDVRAVLDYVVAQPWADRDRLLVIGQSHGGWTTLAFGAQPYPGVKGLINFAGGLRQENCPGWESTLARAAGSYGRETRVPSIWFYGDNDSYFSTSTFHAMFDQYVAGGAPAQLVAYGTFGTDSHALFGARAGAAIWQPEVSRFLERIGLPSQPRAEFARYGNTRSITPVPPATTFAPLDDATRLPFVRDTGREGYAKFLTQPLPRAFAIATNGAWGWASGGEDPLKRALDNCNRRGQGSCRLYAVDDAVVWNPEAASQP
jgi:dienelactone hydrolase